MLLSLFSYASGRRSNNEENQENHASSMASSVDEDSTQHAPTAVKLTRRAALKQKQQRQQRSHSSPDGSGSISQSPPKTVAKRGGLLDSQDVREMRRNMRQRQQDAADAFALIQPATKTRIDLGINLKGEAPTARLGAWGGMISHRVRLQSPSDVDADVRAWLKAAYDRA